MYDGKKNTSYEILYADLETVKTKLPNEEKSALEIWKKALDNVRKIRNHQSHCNRKSLIIKDSSGNTTHKNQGSKYGNGG